MTTTETATTTAKETIDQLALAAFEALKQMQDALSAERDYIGPALALSKAFDAVSHVEPTNTYYNESTRDICWDLIRVGVSELTDSLAGTGKLTNEQVKESILGRIELHVGYVLAQRGLHEQVNTIEDLRHKISAIPREGNCRPISGDDPGD
jgi:hypothetical protein